jgi:phospholipase C
MSSGLPYRMSHCVLPICLFTMILTACGGGGTPGGGGGSTGPFPVTVSLSGTGTVTSTPAGITCGTTCKANFANGTQVTLAEKAGAGFSFAGWSGACTGASNCAIAVSAASAVTATFQPLPVLQVTVAGPGSVTSNPSGITCPSTCSASFAKNTQVVLTANPASGSAFSGWSGGGCSGTGSCTVAMTLATSVTATFAATAEATLHVTITGGSGTVTSSPSGINCPGTCSAKFSVGASVVLTASAGSGSTFTGWSGGGCSGAGTCQVTITGETFVTATFNKGSSALLTVTTSGTGTGTVTSSPSGINCPSTCAASFAIGTQVTLMATPTGSFNFAGWNGSGCSGTGTCVVTLNTNQTVNAAFGGALSSLNHIIIFAQENRSFDSYFGTMRQYWAQNGFADQPFDGLPQFNPSPGPTPQIPGCDPAFPYNPNAVPPETYPCTYDSNSPAVPSFHLKTMCVENPSPSWNESHVDWDLGNPTATKALLNGNVHTAANSARQLVPHLTDVDGLRAMGYYDGNDLNYYYYMASQFATSDRWFSPAMSRTQINRMYLLSATSQGHAYPLHGNDPQLSATTIFEQLQNAGITWKIYIHPDPKPNPAGGVNCAAFDTRPVCLYQVSYLNMFKFGNKVVNDPVLSLNLVPNTQFATDAQNGTLPQVALIEPASASGLDEHPADFDPSPREPTPCCSVQGGADYASSIINSLMTSPSWKDSALLLTYDEFGGFYDHVSPQPTVSPDGIAPFDLLPGDVCTTVKGPNCDFIFTGYRVPLIVISPFTRKNYVSHLPADSTAMLKLIETRFGLAPLTARDAAQIDMGAEFFDFANAPWATPPTPPAQRHSGACYLDHLP